MSKVILDLRHPSVRQALRDVNDMHRNLMAGFTFPQQTTAVRAEKKVLYRVCEGREQVYVLLTSEEKPDAEALGKRGFLLTERNVRDITPLREVLNAGRMLRFELLASPCCKKRSENQKNSRRVFLRTETERAAWLNRKAEQNGFSILSVMEMGRSRVVSGHKTDMDVQNTAVLFSGTLKIEDSELFWKAYTDGVGPGKAYGLGMLCVSSL